MKWVNSPKLRSIRPYLRIMRLHNMTGTFLSLMPVWWSIGLASGKEIPYKLLLLFLAGAVVMRSAGCIINDMIDRKIDAKVARTKNRPLANGDMKFHEAFLLLFLLLTIALAILMSLNDTTIILGCVIVVPIFVYPFMKRITYWPQAFLALTINWGALMGWAAVTDKINISAIMVYAACMFWTLGYDTIYAHQDKEDDALLGIKSTALKFGHYTRKYVYMFYGIMVLLLWIVGIIVGSSVLYHVFLIFAAFLLFWQATTVNLDNPGDCMRKFSSNRYVGLVIFAGVLAGKIAI